MTKFPLLYLVYYNIPYSGCIVMCNYSNPPILYLKLTIKESTVLWPGPYLHFTSLLVACGGKPTERKFYNSIKFFLKI